MQLCTLLRLKFLLQSEMTAHIPELDHIGPGNILSDCEVLI